MTFLTHIIATIMRIALWVVSGIVGLFLAGIALIIGTFGLLFLKFKMGKMMEDQFKDMTERVKKAQERSQQYRDSTSLDGKTIDVEDYKVVDED